MHTELIHIYRGRTSHFYDLPGWYMRLIQWQWLVWVRIRRCCLVGSYLEFVGFYAGHARRWKWSEV